MMKSLDDAFFNENMLKAIQNVQTAAAISGASAITAVKITAFVPPNVLQKLNQTIEQAPPSTASSTPILDLVSKQSVVSDSLLLSSITGVSHLWICSDDERRVDRGGTSHSANPSYYSSNPSSGVDGNVHGDYLGSERESRENFHRRWTVVLSNGDSQTGSGIARTLQPRSIDRLQHLPMLSNGLPSFEGHEPVVLPPSSGF